MYVMIYRLNCAIGIDSESLAVVIEKKKRAAQEIFRAVNTVKSSDEIPDFVRPDDSK